MSFVSVDFLIFFPVVVILYYALPHKFRWLMLLIASCLFYMMFIPAYILILLVTIVIDYIMGILIEREENPKRRKSFLIISIISTCLVLFVFKYFNFFNANLSTLAGFLHMNYSENIINIILPLGLSFHTFQSLSYVIEIYRGHQKAEKHFGIYSLYVMFFPQLVAGPIERPQNLLHQFREKHELDYDGIIAGLKQILVGFFKKVVIADRLAAVVNQVYNNTTEYTGPVLAIATVCFAFQILCDFSGYSDIAIGSARVIGFKLMTNFDKPYISKSIPEFWQRWHISLSTWFRDYVYIPLGGNRVPKWRWQLNLFITFLVSGLWHGANWTFILWGALNGVYMVVSIWTKDIRRRIVSMLELEKCPVFLKILQTMATFIFICFAWILFRANNLKDAAYVFREMFVGWSNIFSLRNIYLLSTQLGLVHIDILIASFSIFALVIAHLLKQYSNFDIDRKPAWLQWGFFFILLFSVVFLGYFDQTKFIYFQF